MLSRRSRKYFVIWVFLSLTSFHALGASRLPDSRVKRSEDDPAEAESRSRSSGYSTGDSGSDRGYERDDDIDDHDDEDSKSDDGGWWNTTFGVLMYFIMVLFFALQVTLLIFCLGIFIRNVCCGSNRSNTTSSSTTNSTSQGGQTNLGHSPDAPAPLDEASKLIIQQLKDPNEKVTLVFEASPDTPIVNNWVGDTTGDVNSPDRPCSRVSTTTLDSNVSVLSSKHSCKWVCSICLSPKMTSLNSLPCMHAFHKTCLHDFVLYSLEHNMPVKCPVCRCKLKVNLS